MFTRFKYFRHARRQRLSDVERRGLRDGLQAFMEAHPVRVDADMRPVSQRPNPLRSFFSLRVLRPLPVAGFLLLLGLGAGTASAAERALPDNPLYFVKLHVNEPVRRVLAVTPVAKAKLETELVTRRLEEAEALAASGTVDRDAQDAAARRFTEQAGRVQARIRDVKAADGPDSAAELVSDLEASLRHRQETLSRAARLKGEADAGLRPVLERLEETRAAVGRDRRSLEGELRRRRSDGPSGAASTTRAVESHPVPEVDGEEGGRAERPSAARPEDARRDRTEPSDSERPAGLVQTDSERRGDRSDPARQRSGAEDLERRHQRSDGEGDEREARSRRQRSEMTDSP